MNELQILGKQPFMGKEIPIVLGGFGKDKKCICDKTIAEVHGMETFNIRKRISDNLERFQENSDYLDFKKVIRQTNNFTICSQIGYSRMEVSRADHIYILSERGYLKLVKIMDNEKAWEIYNNLLDEYFYMREEHRQQKLPTNYLEALKALVASEEEKQSLLVENGMQQQLIAEFSPKVSYYDLVLQTKDVIAISSIAKDYGKSAKWMNEKLHELGVQFKRGDTWLLYQKYAKLGYTHSKTHTYSGDDGEQHSSVHTYWTQKGRRFIYDLLKSEGIYPLIEMEDNLFVC